MGGSAKKVPRHNNSSVRMGPPAKSFTIVVTKQCNSVTGLAGASLRRKFRRSLFH